MIELRNVCVNNLKGIDLDIEPGSMLLFCGLSGSGKSSLALDTLFAEGQRRYLECLSPQARRYVTLLDKPQADRIAGVPPAIAVGPRQGAIPPKATVGSVTELAAALAQLFIHCGTPACPACQIEVSRDDPESIARLLAAWPSSERFQIGFLLDSTLDPDQQRSTALADGFARGIWREQTVDLRDPPGGCRIGLKRRQVVAGRGGPFENRPQLDRTGYRITGDSL